MKKVIYLILLIFLTIEVIPIEIKNNTKENKVYSRKIDLSSEDKGPSALDIDNKVLIDRSKEILKKFYPDEDFDKYESKLYMPYSKCIYVDFLKTGINNIEYEIGYKVNDGSISELKKNNLANIVIEKNVDYIKLAELRDEGLEYLRKLKVADLNEYILNNEILDSYSYFAYYRNVLLNKDLNIHIDPETYELLYFSIYDGSEY